AGSRSCPPLGARRSPYGGGRPGRSRDGGTPPRPSSGGCRARPASAGPSGPEGTSTPGRCRGSNVRASTGKRDGELSFHDVEPTGRVARHAVRVDDEEELLVPMLAVRDPVDVL